MLEAYERLIHDAMSGDHTLFTTAEGIERLWELSTPLLEDPPPVRPYAPGSWGPNAIHQLIAPHAWRLPFERAWRATAGPRALTVTAKPDMIGMPLSGSTSAVVRSWLTSDGAVTVRAATRRPASVRGR